MSGLHYNPTFSFGIEANGALLKSIESLGEFNAKMCGSCSCSANEEYKENNLEL